MIDKIKKIISKVFEIIFSLINYGMFLMAIVIAICILFFISKLNISPKEYELDFIIFFFLFKVLFILALSGSILSLFTFFIVNDELADKMHKIIKKYNQIYKYLFITFMICSLVYFMFISK